MALEVFSSIPREFATAPMEYLWAKWRTLRATNDLSLQRLIEESSYPLRANSIYLLSSGDDFTYIYVGKAMQEAVGLSLAGMLLSQRDTPLAKDFAAVYRQVAKRMAPVFVRFTGADAQTGRIWQRLVLPVPLPGDAVILVVYSEIISHHAEIYEHLFRTAPDAMVIACPIANDVGHTTDGWVLMMNDRARVLLNFTGSIGNLRLSELPQFAGIDLWGRLYAPKSAAAAMALATADFNIELMRFPRAFGLRLSPKAALVEPVPLAPAAPSGAAVTLPD